MKVACADAQIGKYSVRSSAIRLVRVVTRIRSLRPIPRKILLKVVHLIPGFADINGRVGQAGGPDNLFDQGVFRFFKFIGGRRGGYKDDLERPGFEFPNLSGRLSAEGSRKPYSTRVPCGSGRPHTWREAEER
jgi:hypothetical protein